jgi:hypothetical protein
MTASEETPEDPIELPAIKPIHVEAPSTTGHRITRSGRVSKPAERLNL